MYRNILIILVGVALFLPSCIVEGTYTGEITPPPLPQYEMVLTMQGSGEKTISMAGTGEVSIDWGDGSVVSKQTLTATPREFKHTYSGAAATRSIKINGENITSLNCRRSELISIDISKNNKLEILNCSFNKLTSLDVENNNALKEFSCNNNELKSLKMSNNNTVLHFIDISTNNLNAGDLNTFFGLLHNTVITGKIIYIAANDGTVASNKNIAIANGWEVNDERVLVW